MKKLLSLPPNLVGCFHDVARVSRDEYYCTSDPIGARIGSGGGTHWLLKQCAASEQGGEDFAEWLSREKRIILHAGGQSRRLPAYAPSGKILTPIPVFRWQRGQRIGQNLLQLQLPLYEKILAKAPDSLCTLIASGDVYIRAGELQAIPDADVVCYGLWVDAALAKNHGVFLIRRDQPGQLDFMLQKPSVERIGQLMPSHYCLMDIGIWLLSDRAVERLCQQSTDADGNVCNYDLYSQFGCALGQNPSAPNPALADLTVAILPLEGGAFYHYGTTREMISSTMAVQNLVFDQRAIMHLGEKPHPSIFTQNMRNEIAFTPQNENTWVENSWIGARWSLSFNNVVTGVPRNDWPIHLQPGQCVDIVPIGERAYAVRPYGFDDKFAGDLQDTPLFPVTESLDEMGELLQWMLAGKPADAPTAKLYDSLPKLSANQISDRANLLRLQQQRDDFMRGNLAQLAKNHRRSVFYQTNLADMAEQFHRLDVPMPAELPQETPLLLRASDQLFRARLLSLRGDADGAAQAEAQGFAHQREAILTSQTRAGLMPRLNVQADQIVWSRSPVRIDIAGGWTDTPPYCLMEGGNVVNLAIELNGQPPLQAYIKPCQERHIVLRSIDLGASEIITTWDELHDFARVGSPFSIPKAALCLAGFHPQFCAETFKSLAAQLDHFGCGLELTLLSAIPAGSGLGTSSILAATVLGAISDFCALEWDHTDICNQTLVLEQLLTTGGGWQDQYGGVLRGVKLLRTTSGLGQTPEIRWLPDTLYTAPEYAPCHLLYYTGITRTAKQILAEIVKNMFLCETQTLQQLSEMKTHAMEVYKAILRGDFEGMGRLIGHTWEQNKRLDSGTNPPTVESIIDLVKDYCLGYKLPGAGGGGYLYMVAKDLTAAERIRQTLSAQCFNNRARFVEMSLSHTGLQVSRS